MMDISRVLRRLMDAPFPGDVTVAARARLRARVEAATTSGAATSPTSRDEVQAQTLRDAPGSGLRAKRAVVLSSSDDDDDDVPIATLAARRRSRLAAARGPEPSTDSAAPVSPDSASDDVVAVGDSGAEAQRPRLTARQYMLLHRLEEEPYSEAELEALASRDVSDDESGSSDSEDELSDDDPDTALMCGWAPVSDASVSRDAAQDMAEAMLSDKGSEAYKEWCTYVDDACVPCVLVWQRGRTWALPVVHRHVVKHGR